MGAAAHPRTASTELFGAAMTPDTFRGHTILQTARSSGRSMLESYMPWLWHMSLHLHTDCWCDLKFKVPRKRAQRTRKKCYPRLPWSLSSGRAQEASTRWTWRR